MVDQLRERLGSAVIVLGTVRARPILVVAVTQDLVEHGLHAGKLVRELAKTIGGGGGGSPTMAQAGGRDSSKIDEALGRARGLVAETLSRT